MICENSGDPYTRVITTGGCQFVRQVSHVLYKVETSRTSG